MERDRADRFRAGKAGAKALRDRLGSDEAVSAHYRELQRKSAERRRLDRDRRAGGAVSDRARWRHRTGDRYVPVFGDYWGNERDGFHREWTVLGNLHDTLDAAKSAGFKAQGSDDFNVAVVRPDGVAALLWMEEDMAEERDVLAEVQKALVG